MAAHTVCTPCRQVLRQQLQQICQARTTSLKGRTLFPQVNSMCKTFSTAQCSSATYSEIVKPYQPRRSLATSAPIQPTLSDSGKPNSEDEKSHGGGTARALAKELRKRSPSTTETYVAYGVCEKLVKECARQADYTIPQAQEKGVEVPKTKDGEDLGVATGWWYETLGLTPTFNTWAQITFLHMYLLTVRLRSFPPAHAPSWHQHLLDHFFYIAEDHMVTQHNMAARMVRNKYLKDLFVQWRGLMAGYDEGLVRGDAVLATAVWRNLFKAEEGVDFRGVGEVVSYMRGVLAGLDQMEDDGIAGGEVAFGSPGSERNGVLVRSRLMDAAPASQTET